MAPAAGVPRIWRDALAAYDAERDVYEARRERERLARLQARRKVFVRALAWVLFRQENPYGWAYTEAELRRRGVGIAPDGLSATYHGGRFEPVADEQNDREVVMRAPCPACLEAVVAQGDLAALGAAMQEHDRTCGRQTS